MPTYGEDRFAELGLGADATWDQVRLARRELARRWHPDMRADTRERQRAEGKMAQINAAYHWLQENWRDIERARAARVAGETSRQGGDARTRAGAPPRREPQSTAPRPAATWRRTRQPGDARASTSILLALFIVTMVLAATGEAARRLAVSHRQDLEKREQLSRNADKPSDDAPAMPSIAEWARQRRFEGALRWVLFLAAVSGGATAVLWLIRPGQSEPGAMVSAAAALGAVIYASLSLLLAYALDADGLVVFFLATGIFIGIGHGAVTAIGVGRP